MLSLMIPEALGGPGYLTSAMAVLIGQQWVQMRIAAMSREINIGQCRSARRLWSKAHGMSEEKMS